jgi:hypothetical protein
MYELNRVQIYAPCVISYPHSRACPLIGSFLLGFTYCDGRERESDRNIILRCSFIVLFLRGFILWQQGTCFYVCLWYKRERISKHSAISALGPSYKSDSLVFRCSFYYLIFFGNTLWTKVPCNGYWRYIRWTTNCSSICNNLPCFIKYIR